MQCMALLTELAGFASSSLSNSNNRFYRHNRQSGKRFSQIVVIVLCLCRTTIITACRARHLSREGENTLKLITIFNILTILQSLLSVPIRNPSKHFPKEVFQNTLIEHYEQYDTWIRHQSMRYSHNREQTIQHTFQTLQTLKD